MRYQLEPHKQQTNSAPPFPGMSLQSFMEHTTTYEDMPVPFAPSLRQHTWIGIGAIATCTLLMLLFRAIGSDASRGLFVLGGQLSAYLDWLIGSTWLFWMDMLLLAPGVALLVLTKGLKQGKQFSHKLAFALFLCGLANIFLFLFPVTVLVINLILFLLWISPLLFILLLLFSFSES